MTAIERKAFREVSDARCPTCGGRIEEKGRDAEGRLILICSSCGSIKIIKKAEGGDE